MPVLYLVLSVLISASLVFFIVWNRARIIRKAKRAIIEKQRKQFSEKGEDKSEKKNIDEVNYTETEKKKIDLREMKQSLRRAEILLAHNEEEEGEKILVSLLARDPDNIDAHIFLASLYLKRKQYSRAEALYKTLNDLQKGKNAATLSNLAFCLFEQNKIEASVEFYRAARDVEPKNVKRYSNLGQALFVLKELEEAESLFTKGVKLAPRDTGILFMLADTQRENKKFKKALETYKKILDYEPYNEEAREEVSKLEEAGY